jgi:acetyl-CoA carboxylase carboxyl transferase subunit alpha
LLKFTSVTTTEDVKDSNGKDLSQQLILWNDPTKVETATKALKITPDDLLEHKLIDDILEEPLIGAHRDKATAAEVLKNYFLESVKELKELSVDELLDQRYKRLTAVGAYSE